MGNGVARILASALFAFGCAGLAGCSTQSNSGFQAVANSSPNPAASPGAFVSTSDYQVRPGDVLQINVFQLQDFNREAPVDAAGTIALPLIGAVPVAGKTVRQIESEIAQRLKCQIPSKPAGARVCKGRGWPARRGARGGQKSRRLPVTRRHDPDECYRAIRGVHRDL